ncbi:hypothetical protein T265_00430 [Opisthorchis viverrini]|uniref:Uncharacterized protein n=1 Tax=Opisthorchis viverrini TaxID=6198 RepID=A0A075A322_OPIVI|nr:hypothetical protein T265_00430 [Opisthorchis viverrini]KER33746.1 hypothetical protein T265_00430 [Opisthorchis viverrini]
MRILLDQLRLGLAHAYEITVKKIHKNDVAFFAEKPACARTDLVFPKGFGVCFSWNPGSVGQKGNPRITPPLHHFAMHCESKSRCAGERQPLTDKNKTHPGNFGKSLDPVYQSVNP